MALTVADIARHIQGTVIGDASAEIRGFAPADRAGEGDLTFAENAAYLQKACEGRATAVLVPAGLAREGKVLIQVANVRLGFAKTVHLLMPPAPAPAGVHPTAVVDPTAKVDPTAHIGPHCVIAERAEIGPGCLLESLVRVGPCSMLVEGCHLFSHVTLYAGTRLGRRVRVHAGTVIGADGFGYIFDQGAHFKVPQIGHVEIGDDVEIGANVTIDRGAMGPTVIGRGTKIDNLVQIAHNVVVGEHSILVAQVGISGSTRLGSFVTLAGQVGLAGHLTIGDRVMVGAKSGVMHDIPAGETWLGIPARPDRLTKRQLIAAQRLPEMVRRLRDLEKRLERIESSGRD